jgi:outer membrane lipoprotein carrier protein
VLLIAIVLAFPQAAWGIDAEEVVENLQKRFAETRSLSARFERRHYWKLVDQEQKIKGRLHVQKPDKFRFETHVQTVVTDGKTAWNYSPGNNQVVLSGYETVQDDRSYEKLLFDLILLGGYLERFDTRYGGETRIQRKRCHIVELTSRDEERYITQVRLWIDRKSWVVLQVEYRNINEDVTTYVLSDTKANKDLDASLFRFNPPNGVEIVDLR